MEYYIICKILVVTLITEEIASYTIRQKRSSQKFNLLLNLYKMSPLKNSNVFKMFSNTVLLPNRGDNGPGLNLDSNESVKRKEKDTIVQLKQIEEKIHVTKSPRINMGQPEYKLPTNQLEEFVKPMYSVRDLATLKRGKDFSELVLYEISGKKPKVTKMLPINKVPLYLDNNMIVLGNAEQTEAPLSTSTKGRTTFMEEEMVVANELNEYYPDPGVIVI